MKLALGLLSLALAALLALQWRDWPPQVGQVAAGGGAPEGQATGLPDPVAPMDLLAPPVEREDYASVVERPLFMPTRRPPEEEPEEPEPPPPEEPPPTVALDTFDLNAILITPSDSIAWVRSPSTPTPQRLRTGDEVEGWTVKAIMADQIELERQGDTDTLILRDYQNSPPPVARSPRRPTRPGTAVRRPVQPPTPQLGPGPGAAAQPEARRQSRTSTNAEPP